MEAFNELAYTPALFRTRLEVAVKLKVLYQSIDPRPTHPNSPHIDSCRYQKFRYWNTASLSSLRKTKGAIPMPNADKWICGASGIKNDQSNCHFVKLELMDNSVVLLPGQVPK